MGKKKAPKLPKQIAGVKIPKELRKSGGALLAKVNTPAGRELLAAGLVAAGTAIANRDGLRAAARKMAHDGEEAADGIRHRAGRFAEMMNAAATAAMDGWRTGWVERGAAADDAKPDGAVTH